MILFNNPPRDHSITYSQGMITTLGDTGLITDLTPIKRVLINAAISHHLAYPYFGVTLKPHIIRRTKYLLSRAELS